MKCYKCKENNTLYLWKITTKKCISTSCGEDQARVCPNCKEVASHVYLDTQKEWKESEFYKK